MERMDMLRRGSPARDWVGRDCGHVALAALVVVGGLLNAGEVLAQAAPAGSIGAQLNTMAAEATSAGGTMASALFYVAALVIFGLSGWALWQSRSQQNRENGMVGKGIAGLILCGLLVSAGTWINFAATTSSGGAATVGAAPAVIQFGAGGGGGGGG